MVQRLCRDAERGQVALAFLAKGRREEFNQRISFALPPAPGLIAGETRHRIEGKARKHLGRRGLGTIIEHQREPLETRNVDVAGLRKIVETVANTKLALVEAEGLRSDQGAPNLYTPALAIAASRLPLAASMPVKRSARRIRTNRDRSAARASASAFSTWCRSIRARSSGVSSPT